MSLLFKFQQQINERKEKKEFLEKLIVELLNGLDDFLLVFDKENKVRVVARSIIKAVVLNKKEELQDKYNQEFEINLVADKLQIVG
jgi:ATP-dependent protease HslVU (ClpYQ) peptidase subunit